MSEERYLGESDWDDLDLITYDEAVFRFDEEVQELKAALAAAPTPAEAAALEARLAMVEETRDRFSKRPTFTFPKA